MYTGFWLENLKETDHLYNQAWMKTFKMILKEMGSKGMDRIHLAQDMDQW